MSEPLTREQLILWRRSIEVETLTGWPVEKVALIDTALHYWTVADDLGNDLKQQASVHRAKREQLEARLREAEAERDELRFEMMSVDTKCRNSVMEQYDRAEKAEAERDALRVTWKATERELAEEKARVAELEECLSHYELPEGALGNPADHGLGKAL